MAYTGASSVLKVAIAISCMHTEILAMLSGRQTRICNLLQVPAKQHITGRHPAGAPGQGMGGLVKHFVREDRVSTTMKMMDMKELLLPPQRM